MRIQLTRHSQLFSAIRRTALGSLLAFGLLGGCVNAPPVSTLQQPSAAAAPDSWQGYSKLSGAQIREAFSDVVDTAVVVDGAGGSATNRWFQDGRFTSDWQAGGQAGQLSGRWSVEGDARCIVLDIELDGYAAGQQRCGPIYFKDGKYYSSNANGSMHGIHTLSALDLPTNGK